MRFAPFLILLLPILEIAGFIVVGDAIGVLATIGLVVVTAVVGVMLVRLEGVRLITEIRRDMDAGRVPADKLLSGAALAVAGVLFIVPGFLTDILAILLLLPPVRNGIAGWATRNAVVTTHRFRTARPRAEPGVVDLDPDDYTQAGDGPSPWRDDGSEPPVIGPR